MPYSDSPQTKNYKLNSCLKPVSTKSHASAGTSDICYDRRSHRTSNDRHLGLVNHFPAVGLGRVHLDGIELVRVSEALLPAHGVDLPVLNDGAEPRPRVIHASHSGPLVAKRIEPLDGAEVDASRSVGGVAAVAAHGIQLAVQRNELEVCARLEKVRKVVPARKGDRLREMENHGNETTIPKQSRMNAR